MIFVYDKKATELDLQKNGLSRVEAISCTVLEKMNSDFYADLTVQLSGIGAEFCTVGAILRIPCHRNLQYFRIWSTDQDLTTIKIKAWHISYDLSAALIINDHVHFMKNGQEALSGILAAAETETRFSGTSDIAEYHTARLWRCSVLTGLIGSDEEFGFLPQWGGEAYRDNFRFDMMSRIGAETDFEITYRKNLTGFSMTVDTKSLATRIMPTALKADGTILYLPEYYIDSANIETYAIAYVKAIEYNDIQVGKVVEGAIPYPDNASAYTEMRARVAKLYADGIDLPKISAKIDLIMLGDTIEYSQYADLESVNLGDDVIGRYKDTVISNRVTEITYDGLAKRITKVALGESKIISLADTLNYCVKQIQKIQSGTA